MNQTWTKRDMLSGGLASSGRGLISQLLEQDQYPCLTRKACESNSLWCLYMLKKNTLRKIYWEVKSCKRIWLNFLFVKTQKSTKMSWIVRIYCIFAVGINKHWSSVLFLIIPPRYTPVYSLKSLCSQLQFRGDICAWKSERFWRRFGVGASSGTAEDQGAFCHHPHEGRTHQGAGENR